MSNRSNTSQDIISEIEQKAQGGGYIYRGERKCNPKVSSTGLTPEQASKLLTPTVSNPGRERR